MKYSVKFFVVTFFLLVCTYSFAEQKIVVLDMKYVLNNSKAGKGAQDFLKKSLNTFFIILISFGTPFSITLSVISPSI